MTRAPDGSPRAVQAAYLRWEGKGFAAIAQWLGYDSPDEAEKAYETFMASRRGLAVPTPVAPDR